MRHVHDRGDWPNAGPAERAEHNYAMWEKRTDAMLRILSSDNRSSNFCSRVRQTSIHLKLANASGHRSYHNDGHQHRDGKSDNALLVEDTNSCCQVLLSSSSHRIRNEFPVVIVTDKDHDFVVRHCLLILVL